MSHASFSHAARTYTIRSFVGACLHAHPSVPANAIHIQQLPRKKTQKAHFRCHKWTQHHPIEHNVMRLANEEGLGK